MPDQQLAQFLSLLSSLDSGQTDISTVQPSELAVGLVLVRKLYAHTCSWINASRTVRREIRLPFEIIREIFYIFADANTPLLGSSRREDSGWHVLLRLCKSWYRNLMEDGRFWAIVAPHNPSTMPITMQRAGQWTSCFVLTEILPRAVAKIRPAIEPLALAAFEPSRHHVIHVERNQRAFETLHKILTVAASTNLDRLESLTMRSNAYGQTSRQADEMSRTLHAGFQDVWIRASSLKYANFHGMSANLQSDSLRTLLISYRSWSTARPANSTLIDTLRRSGDKLERMELLWATGSPSSSTSPVTLPKLTDLLLWGEDVDVMNVLQLVQTPALHTANVLLEITSNRDAAVILERQLMERMQPAGDWDTIRVRISDKTTNHYGLSMSVSFWRRADLNALGAVVNLRADKPRLSISLRTKSELLTWADLAGPLLSRVRRAATVLLQLPDDTVRTEKEALDTLERTAGRSLDNFLFEITARTIPLDDYDAVNIASIY
ncbi:unnamed protein product [Peniophora sp. CBMAI 1063]|nr:unnamed protein product [Peniophora sp. CBMAI 1063]